MVKSTFALMLAAGLTTGCATYTNELVRARQHYDSQQFPRALAVLRALGEDLDALGPSEQVRFGYLRGMTDFRLSELVSGQEASARPGLRACARDWLSWTLARSNTRESLTAEEILRARQTLARLADVEAAGGACLPEAQRAFLAPLSPPRDPGPDSAASPSDP